MAQIIAKREKISFKVGDSIKVTDNLPPHKDSAGRHYGSLRGWNGVIVRMEEGVNRCLCQFEGRDDLHNQHNLGGPANRWWIASKYLEHSIDLPPPTELPPDHVFNIGDFAKVADKNELHRDNRHLLIGKIVAVHQKDGALALEFEGGEGMHDCDLHDGTTNRWWVKKEFCIPVDQVPEDYPDDMSLADIEREIARLKAMLT